MFKRILLFIAAVLVIGGVAFYFVVLKDDPAPELSVDGTAPSRGLPTTETDATARSGATTATPGTSATADGRWKVDPTATDNAVGLRIQETFVGGVAKHTAVGRTSTVTGDITIAAAKVTTGSFKARLADIEFTDTPAGLNVANRKQAIARAGLETNTYPEASFKLTTPIDLGRIPPVGEVVTMSATGDLTLHGVTKRVTFKVDAKIADTTIVIATSDTVPVKLSDYSMKPPAFGPVADVSDTGRFEFKLTLAKG